MTGSDVFNIISVDSLSGRYFHNETTDSAKNTSAPVIYISETKLAALFNQWSSLESDVSLERSCLGENEPPRWEARRTTNLRLGEATAALLDHVQWDHVVILTDGASDDVLPLPRRVIGKPATYSIFTINVGQEAANIEEALDLVAEFRERHFIIACEMNCVREVFHQANTFDTRKDQQGFFTYSHQWIIVAKHRRQLDDIELFLGNVSHVVALVPAPDTRTVPQREVDELTRMARAVVMTATNEYHVITGSAFESRNAAFRASPSPAFKVFTAFYEKDGRKFQQIGNYESSKLCLTSDQDMFPNVKFGLNGRHLIVSTNYWSSFMTKTITNGRVTYKGLCYDMLKEMAKTMNFSYTIVEPPDGQWGVISNGTYNGVIGQLQHKEVDLVMGALTREAQREQYIDFNYVPFHIALTTVALIKPDLIDITVGPFFRPFKLEVWGCILAAIPIIGVALLLFARACGAAAPKRHKQELQSTTDALWFSVGALLQQGSERIPKHWAVRFVFLSWWLFCIIIVAIYGANLVAFLAVSQRSLPFETLEEMTAQTDYKYGMMGGTVWTDLFKNSTWPVYKKMWDTMQRNAEHDADIISSNYTRQFRKMEHEKFAYISDVKTIQAEMALNCHITMLDVRFMPMHYTVGFQNNSAYKTFVDEQFMRFFASGLFAHWRKKYWPKPAQCSSREGPKALGLYQLHGAFYITFVLTSLSCLVLAVEMVVSSITSRSKKRNHIVSPN
ncbi:hypothetical protein NP493_975g02012 [Ridgeia piscesae]|uniref:Uncharacterized protein n=1 Tax=Ridgeia piscesae TaxID=27915 RepID=A0AAD9NM66_RIDPI|nr:hypothetical protein NP493_975g02012 [Ridgeia piscesae]